MSPSLEVTRQQIRERVKRWRAANPQKVKAAQQRARAKMGYKSKARAYEWTRQRREEMRGFLRELKADTPCSDCRERYPWYVMQFDHRDPRKKAFMLSKIRNVKSMDTVKQEITKCDIVCANCHAIRTHNGQHHLHRNTRQMANPPDPQSALW